MPELRMGFVGSGFMGRTHVDAASRLASTVPVAIAGGSRAEKVASDYGLETEPSFRELVVRDDIDAIVVSTPHWCHAEESLAAAEAGKHVLVEKPMATRLDDARTMRETFEQRGLVLKVGYHQRFREANRLTGELIAEGRIGRVRCIQTSALFDITPLRSDKGFGGNWNWWTDPRSVAHLMNSGPHNIDLCRWWLGSDIETVSAASGTFREDNPNENTTMCLLTFLDGTMATFWSTSVLSTPGFTGEAFRFRLMGDKGFIDLDPYDRLIVGTDGVTETVFQQPPVGHDDSDAAFGLPRMQAYCDQMQSFVDSIEGLPNAGGTAKDGEAGVAAVLAILQAATQREVVSLTQDVDPVC